MPTLVHLADERDSSSIKKNGIKIGKFRQGVFCMPVLQSFYLSHQWLRELKRNGANTFVGVYFKMDCKTKVFAGKYNSGHRYIELGEAIKEIKSMNDPLGYEIIIDKEIDQKDIHKIKNLPQNIGWRYHPNSKGRKPCACDMCIKGSVKANSLRKRFGQTEIHLSYNDILEQLKVETNIFKIESLLFEVENKKRKIDPTQLLFLLEMKSNIVDRGLASALKVFDHKATKPILINLLDKTDYDTREIASYSLLELNGKEIISILEQKNDKAINESIKSWLD